MNDASSLTGSDGDAFGQNSLPAAAQPLSGNRPIPASAVDLRPARLEDLPFIAAIEREAFGPSAWSEVSLRHELTGPDRYYTVAESNSVVVGGPAVQDGPAENSDAMATGLLGYGGIFLGDVGEVMTVAVRPQAQGHGIGRRLMLDLMAAARRAGLGRVLLEVRVDNDPAICLYTSLGFERISVRRRYYQPEDVDALIMQAHLSSGVPPSASAPD